MAGVIKLRILRQGGYTGLLDGPEGPQGPLKVKNRGRGVREKDLEIALKMEEGATSQGLRFSL